MIEDAGDDGESLCLYPNNILSIQLFSGVLNYKISNLRELAKVYWNFNMANQPKMKLVGNRRGQA